jgi:hypothetical protein
MGSRELLHGAMRGVLPEHLPQDNRIVMVKIACREEQGHATVLIDHTPEPRHCRGILIELLAIATLELGPSRGLMPEPSPQRVVCRDLLEPEVDASRAPDRAATTDPRERALRLAGTLVRKRA